MTIEACTQAICDLALKFGEDRKGGAKEDIMSRPFGVALLIAGVDENGPALWHTDPSGTFVQFDAKAIGAGSDGAQSALQEQYNKSMTLQQAETLALQTLKQVMEEKLNASNVELAVVPASNARFRPYTRAELEPLTAAL